MKKFLKVVLVLVLLTAVGVGVFVYVSHQQEEAKYIRYTGEYFYDYGIGQYIPTMKLRSGQAPKTDYDKNNDNEMFLQVKNASKEDDFSDYVGLLINYGFVNDVKRDNREYIAVDSDKHKVRVYNWGNGTILVEASAVK